MTARDAPEVVLVNCPTCVLSVDEPLVPALTVNTPVLTILPVPLTVLLPETVSVTPPLAVRLLGSVMLPLLVLSDNVPDEAPPIDMVLESVMPLVELILNEVIELGVVPTVKVELP